MQIRRMTPGLGLAFMGAMAMASCGGEAQSADDQQSTRVPASQPALEPAAQTSTAVPAETRAAQPVKPSETAPAAEPTRSTTRPVIRPARPLPGNSTASTARDEDRADGAADARSGSGSRGEMRALEAGRTLDLTVEAKLSTSASKVGDPFTATATDDVLGSGGEVLLPMGTQFKGRVVQSQESTGSDQPAVLALQVESVTVNGVERPLKATVVELDVKTEARDSGTRTAAKVGIGAAAGALVGQILGKDREGTLKGAAVGAAAGTAAAIATKDGHATVEQGARMMIRLDERLMVGG